jgi:copper chaperone NosL
MKRKLLIAMFAAACFGPGCDREEAGGPPEVRFGRDECAECKMSIVEERSAAAARVQTPDGPDVLLFDDLGCLIDLESSAQVPALEMTERWTRDYGSRKWTRAETATFVFSEKIRTPMGSWIAAFAAPAVAEASHREVGGELLTYEQLVVRRREWMEQRYGKRRP